jgi:hypothetical protein
MAKLSNKKHAAGYTASKISDLDLKKDRFLTQSAEIIFPSDEVIPCPPEGFRVIFLAFLLCGLSLHVHKFLRGILFVYGVQLHQLPSNSIIHIVCFYHPL